MTAPSIRTLPMADWDRWDAFVGDEPLGSLFQTAWWYQAWGVQPEIVAVTDPNGDITAGMAVQIGRRFGFRAICRPTMTPVNAPIIRLPGNGSAGSRQSHIRQQLQLLIANLPKVAMIDVALHDDLLETAQFHWLGFDAMIGLTYVIPADTADWRAGMSPQRRRHLKKASNELVERGGSLDPAPPVAEVAALLANTAEVKNYRRSVQSDLARIEPWWRAVEKHGAGRLYGLRDASGQLLCASVLVWDKRKAYYLGGGVQPAIRRSSHLNCLLFEQMINDSLARGLDFDFEGSMLHGVERFFRAWGGLPRPTYRFIKIGSPAAFACWQTYRFFNLHRRPLLGQAGRPS